MTSGLLAVAAGTWLQDQVLPNITGTGTYNGAPYASWPHTFDVYIPSTGVDRCYLMLHGAGDTKRHYGFYLNVLNTKGIGGAAQPNWPLINYLRSIIVIPQGQHCNGVQSPKNNTPPYINAVPTASFPLGITTWQNGYMNSGWEDMTGAVGTFHNAGGFIYDLRQYLNTTYAPPKIYLGGHSNGGFMAHRWWMEGADIFDGYFATSGLAATNLSADPVASANRTKFMWVQLGLLDTILGTANQGLTSNIDTSLAPWYHFFDSALQRPTAQASVEDLESTHEGPWATLLKRVAGTSGETVSQAAFQASAVAAGGPQPASGNLLVARYNSDKLVLRLLDKADHHLPTHERALGVYSILQTFNTYIASLP